jgi:hypothetical protein
VVLEKYLRAKGEKALKAQGQPLPQIDPSDPDEFDRQMRAEHGPPPQYTTAPPTRQGTLTQNHGNGRSEYPQQKSVPEQRHGGFFSGFRSKKQQPDVERGEAMGMHQDARYPNSPNNDPQRNQSTLQKSRR